MHHTQFLRDGSLHRQSTPDLRGQVKNPQDGGSGGDLSEVASPRIGSDPLRDSPEPFHHVPFRLKDDDDLPSLTNGSTSGSRTSSVATNFEHSNPSTDFQSLEQQDRWPVLGQHMPCSLGRQFSPEPNSMGRAGSVARSSYEAIAPSPRALVGENSDITKRFAQVPAVTVMAAGNNQQYNSADSRVTNTAAPQATMEDINSDMEDSSSSEETDDSYDDDDDDENSNDSWSLQTHNLEASVLKAFRYDMDLAAFFLCNLNNILGLHNSRDIAKGKVTSWIPGIKYSPNSSETGSGSSGQTQSSYGYQVSSGSGKQGKRQRPANGSGTGGEENREDEEGQEGRYPKKMKENEPDDEIDGDPLLACPFWKMDPEKYNALYHPDATSRRGKYRTCEGPGFTNMQRLKEHLRRIHTHVQCLRCGFIFDGSNHAIQSRKLVEHQRLETPCLLQLQILKEGISDAQWVELSRLSKQPNKKSKAPCPLPKNTVQKWNGIWAVLFPEKETPSNPWHPRGGTQTQFTVSGDSPVGSFQKLYEAALHREVNAGSMFMDVVTLSRAVDVATQTLILSLSPGIQDLNLGSSSGFQSSLLEGSYLEVGSSSGGTTIGDQNTNQLTIENVRSHRTPHRGTSQADATRLAHSNSPQVTPADRIYAQAIESRIIPSQAISSRAMNPYQGFTATSMHMQGGTSLQYNGNFDPQNAFETGYQLDANMEFPGQLPMQTMLFDNAQQPFDGQNSNDPTRALYADGTVMQHSPATRYREPRNFSRSSHDPRRQDI